MHIHLPYLIFPWSFNEIRLVVSENSRGHEQYPIYSCRTHQRAITLGKIIEPEHAGDMRIHLWYLIFPWSFIEIRQAVSENLRGQERDGHTDTRTHGRTDARTHGHTDARTHGRRGDYMLPRNSSGSITNSIQDIRQNHWTMKYRSHQKRYILTSIIGSQGTNIQGVTFIQQIVFKIWGKITEPWNIGHTNREIFWRQ